MDENFSNSPENNGPDSENNPQGTENKAFENKQQENDNASNLIKMDERRRNENDVNRFTMDNNGNIRTGRNGTAAVTANPRTFLILGWVCAALTAFVWPYFAVAGVIFGLLANRQARGSGNVVIVANIVLGIISLLLFRYFLIVAMRRMMFGY